MNIRKNYVNGQFYPNNEIELSKIIKTFILSENLDNNLFINKKLIGGISPHAGYMFSGYQMVHLFNLLKYNINTIDTIVIINPSHSGIGEDISITDYDEWNSVYDNIKLDKEFLEMLELPINNKAQSFEHSGEVMLPMISYFIKKDIKIAPILFNNQNYENAKLLAKKIYHAKMKTDRNIFILASSDFSHYVQSEIGKKLDDIALEDIKKFDANQLIKDIIKNRISICGYGPIATLIEYSKFISTNPKNIILKRGHSGEIMPSDRVVDYISMVFYK